MPTGPRVVGTKAASARIKLRHHLLPGFVDFIHAGASWRGGNKLAELRETPHQAGLSIIARREADAPHAGHWWNSSISSPVLLVVVSEVWMSLSAWWFIGVAQMGHEILSLGIGFLSVQADVLAPVAERLGHPDQLFQEFVDAGKE